MKLYVIAKSKDNSIYRIYNGKAYIDTESRELPDNNKVYGFDKERLAIIDVNKNIVVNKITVLGKYYKGKKKDILYVVCDALGRKQSITKNKILEIGEDRFTNIRISTDNRVRMIGGSIPFLNNQTRSKNTDSVVMIGRISQGTSGSVGVSTKFLGRRLRDDKLGCVKFELFPNSLDLNNEVLAYELGKLLNFDVAEASFESYNDKRCIISIYNYNRVTESISSLKSLVGTHNFYNRFNKKWFIQNMSQSAWDKFLQMIMLDLIMHQTDRHISNIAFKDNDLYSLYDNGRALFYDKLDDIPCGDIDLNNRGSIVDSFVTNEHGYGWMYLEDIVGYDNYKHLIRHDLTREDFSSIIEKTYGTSNRFRNAWIREYMYRTYLIITRQEKRFTR